MNIKTAIQRCLDDLNLAATTRLTYQFGLDAFSSYLESKGVDLDDDVKQIDIDHFVYFPQHLTKGHAKSTTNVYLAATKSFLNWLVIANYLQPSYRDTARLSLSSAKVRKRRESKLPRFPNRDDVEKMLRAARDIPIKESSEFEIQKARDIAMLEFLASSGCRISEVLQLKVKDLDIKNRTTIVTGKGSKERRVWFSTACLEAIKAYWELRKSAAPSDPVFSRQDRRIGAPLRRMTKQRAWQIVRRIANFAGIELFSPHYFRHAFAIKALSQTDNLAVVQDMLGHSNPSATRVYAKIYPEDLEKAHREIFK